MKHQQKGELAGDSMRTLKDIENVKLRTGILQRLYLTVDPEIANKPSANELITLSTAFKSLRASRY